MDIRRLRLDDLHDTMVDGALRVWEQTKGTADPRSLLDALRPLCDATTNLYYVDVSADASPAYRIYSINGAYDLSGRPDWIWAEIPDQRYVEQILLPVYVAADAERLPNFHKMSASVYGRHAVMERVVLPYLDAPGENRACLSLCRMLLLVDDMQPGRPVLSRRERECLHLLAAGKPVKVIALELGLAQKTVEHYIERAKGKLGATNAAQAVAKGMLEASGGTFGCAEAHPGPTEALLPRERQCLGLLASGRTWRQAASDLGLSPKTVEKYVQALKVKLGARNAAEVVALGITDALR